MRDASLMVAHLYGHGHHIEFIQYLKGAVDGAAPQPALVGAAHVCLETDDIQKTWSDLLAAGATAQGKIAFVKSGPVDGWLCRVHPRSQRDHHRVAGGKESLMPVRMRPVDGELRDLWGLSFQP